MRILIAEDEIDLVKALSAVLKHNKYSVDTVFDGQDAFDYGLSGNYDGIILDIMMPKMDGLEVLKRLRESSVKTPIMILTARSQVKDRILGLTSGADDYLSKPFDMGEFTARVMALTRRSRVFTPSNMQIENITLDRETFELSNGKSVVRLGAKEFQLLEMLVINRGHLISTEQIMENIWGCDNEAQLNVVWVYISYLRRKLDSLGAEIEISASRGRGYMLEKKSL